jgi:purine-nucleoside phosphorylase
MKASTFFIETIFQRRRRPAHWTDGEDLPPAFLASGAGMRVGTRVPAVPIFLRPTAPIAPDAILVGDPGRALLLAQELLEQPKMSNHARGLWGYYGSSAAGQALTIQSTGIGGPSAALVLADLAELGVRRAIRVGTCVAVDKALSLGDLLLVGEAIAVGGSASAFGAAPDERLSPEDELTERLRSELGGDVDGGAIASVDSHPGESVAPVEARALDMQTAPLLAQARSLEVAVATTLIVTELPRRSTSLEKDALEDRERLAGRAAAAVLSA